MQALESLKIYILMYCICRKYVMLKLRKYSGVVSSKMTDGLKYDIMSLVNIHANSWK